MIYTTPAEYADDIYPWHPLSGKAKPQFWIERALWHERTRPRYLEKELRKIVKDHVTLDLEDRVKAASDKWLEENR